MTAGDLVQSAGVLCWERKEPGEIHETVECVIRRVSDVRVAREFPRRLEITFEPTPWDFDESTTIELKADTPILITDIRRS